MNPLIDALNQGAPRPTTCIGGVWDQTIRAALAQTVEDPVLWAETRDNLDRHASELLMGFAARTLTWAVRQNVPCLLRDTVEAFALVDYGDKLDVRDIIVAATPLRRACSLVGQNFESLINSPRPPGLPPLPTWLWGLPRRLGPLYRKTGKGPTFEFIQKDSDFDVNDLLARLKKGKAD